VDAALAAPQAAGAAGLDALRQDIGLLSRHIAEAAPRAAVASLEAAMRDLASRVDAALAAPQAAGAEGLDALRQDIGLLSRHIAEAAPRAAVVSLEAAMRDLASRVDAALAAPQAAGAEGFDALRQDIGRLSRHIAEAAPRAAVASLEAAMRDLATRVDAALAAPQAAGAEGLDALRQDIGLLSRHIADAAPRAAVAGLEAAMRDLTERVDASREAMARAVEARPQMISTADLEALSAQVAAMGRDLAESGPRAAAAIEQATRDLSARMDAARDAMIQAAEARREPTNSAEIDALSHQVAAMSRTLVDLAPRSQVTSLENAVRALTARIERSRDEGMREAVLAPIESIADDVRRALAEAGASANFDGVSRQLREVEDKIEQLRADGGGDRAEFLQVYDQTEQIRAMVAEAMDKIAPIERLERQVGALSERLEEVAHQTRAAHAADVALPWGEIEARLNDLAQRIDRAGLERAPAPAPVDDSRFDDLVRRLDYLHDTLAARIENAREKAPAHALEPLLRSLTDKLNAEPAPPLGAEAIEALDRRIAEISQRLERGDSEGERRLHRAIEELADRLEQMRDPEREDRNAREIADLREKTESSDRRAQQTLSAVHETLEKVVDRLAMIEEDVIEARGAAEAAARSPAPARAPVGTAVDSESFLMEPGAGRPPEARDGKRYAPPRDEEDLDDEDPALGLDKPQSVGKAEAKPGAQASYIDVARRALAARVAAEAGDKQAQDARKRAAATVAPPPRSGSAARFVRPLAVGEKGGNRRVPAVLLTAVSVLSLGVYGAHRFFDTASPPMQAVSATSPAPAPHTMIKPEPAPAPPAAPAPSSSAAPAAPDAPLNGAPILPGDVVPPKPEKGASLPDPLATGSIGARTNTMAAVQAGAQSMALKDQAEKGDAVAQYDYAARLAEGRGVNQDPSGAIGWFEKAAAQGMPQAEYRLGAIYEKGLGVARDPKKAADYYTKAANQGHVRAMHNLAVVLAEGVDGKPDYAGAAQWFRRAAEYGVRDSQFNLAILYARGMGVPQDLSQSYVWFAIAAQQGDNDAAKKRDEVAGRLSAAALDRAKKQVEDFHARTPTPSVNDQPSVTAGAAAAASRKPSATRKI
ncbi:MAG TPA: hypothetical protein VMU18_13685, partial [Rhodoblastus sp.]|nr:hypothetical protein [Rhodoblastus sp.]